MRWTPGGPPGPMSAADGGVASWKLPPSCQRCSPETTRILPVSLAIRKLLQKFHCSLTFGKGLPVHCVPKLSLQGCHQCCRSRLH